MNLETLTNVMGRMSGVNYSALLDGYNNAMRAADINTVNRAAMFAAQLRHESGGLRWMREIASGSAYEGRADLGNLYPGDGVRYAGRGPIQLTGRNNYRAFTKWANQNGHTNIDFEKEPQRLEEPKWGFLAAAYYWVAARPDINVLSDRADVYSVTRRINGGTNGLAERTKFFQEALRFGSALLPEGSQEKKGKEVVLDFPRTQIVQDTFYNCGPASVQTIVAAATGRFYTESELGSKLRTTRNGTDWIGQFPSVINSLLPGADYKYVEMPHDPPNNPQKEALWDNLVSSIEAGYGVVANIVAPVSNYPRAVAPSTISPSYGGGTVYHYFAIMGYSSNGPRRVLVADSGFKPYVYWLSFDQLATLIPPKGYAYSQAKPKNKKEGLFMALSEERQNDLAKKIDRIHFELTERFQSRYVDPETNERSKFRDTLVGYILENDAKNEHIMQVQNPSIFSLISKIADFIKKGK